jgi:eukaryotic-like serine/threonine-protein kinase
VYVTRFPEGTGKWPVSTQGGLHPRWRADGRELFFASGADLMAAGVRPSGAEIDIASPVRLFSAPKTRAGFEVSADGQRFLLARHAASVDIVPLTVLLNVLR